MIEIPALEYHVAHGCNLSCEQCSHYSNFHVAGSLPTVEATRQEYAAWSHRLRPRRFALLGGEPTLNPQLIEHVRLARESWPHSSLMLVSNGFFLHRHPELPVALVATNCRLEVSQHGTAPVYLEKFHEVRQLIWRWRADHPRLQIKIRQSHRGWMQQYRTVDGKPMPFSSDPSVAYTICMQKTCMQLFQGKLWKCPALAYFQLVEKKLGFTTMNQWQSFRDYWPCPPDVDDEQLQDFCDRLAISQCGLCPSRRIRLKHPEPTVYMAKLS